MEKQFTFEFDFNQPFTLNNLLYEVYKLGAYEACKIFSLKILKKYPDNLDAELILGLTQIKLGALSDAELHIEKGMSVRNDYNLKLHLELIKNNYENNKLAQVESGCLEIIDQYSSSLSQVYWYLSMALVRKEELAKAIVLLKKTVALDPSSLAYRQLIGLLVRCDEYEEAQQVLNEAIKEMPDSEEILWWQLWLSKVLCDWDAYADCAVKINKIITTFFEKKSNTWINPFIVCVSNTNPEFCYKNAVNLCKAIFGKVKMFTHDLKVKALQSSIKVGYVSTGFRDHPTGRMIANIFKFTSPKFQTHIYSLAGIVDDEYNNTIRKSCSHFVNLKGMSAADIAEKIYNDKIDILVDLDGHINESQFEVFAYRPAPIQITYLGFPGTSGADFIDYIIADKIVIAENQQQYFSEKIIYMPGSYQVNDSEQERVPGIKCRKDYNLPENAFIFACFNSTYKIDYETFKSWMIILKAVPNSILWILDCHEIAKKNICAYAEKLGVDPIRLHFAPYVNKAEHLSRLKMVDILLDTFICNAHSSAADALWSNVPIVTLQGTHFASRVCSSLLSYVGLSKLITHTPKEYEKVAIELAEAPQLLKKYKKQLSETILQTLFNTKLFMQNLEKAYNMVWQRYLEGKKPESIEI